MSEAGAPGQLAARLLPRSALSWQRQCSDTSTVSTGQTCKRQATLDRQRLVSSLVAGLVSFTLATIMGISFGMLVFGPVPGGVALGVQMAIVGVNVAGNAALTLVAQLPCVVVTADNGVVAPIVAGLVFELSREVTEPHELLATSVAGVAIACTVFGLVQLLLVQLNLVRLVQYLPYSIPMGFLSGIGLELCAGISLAGTPVAQAAAVTFAATLCWGTWWRNWPLSALFPMTFTAAVAAFYLLGGPPSWLLTIEDAPPPSGAGGSSELFGLWSPSTFSAVHWQLLFDKGKWPLVTLCLLGCLQNCLFAGLFSRIPGLKVAPNQVLREFSQAFTVGGSLGLAGGFHNMACFSLSRELHSYRRFPGGVTALLSGLLWITGLGPILKVPRFVFAGLLIWVGLKFLRTYLWQPARMLPRSETAVIVCVASIMRVGGFTMGVIAGLVLALISMVSELASLSCVQHVSYGDETRSNVIRSVRAQQLLLRHGQKVMVLRLAPGFVFFATSYELLTIVEKKLHVTSLPWQSQDPQCLCLDSEDEDDEQMEMLAGSPGGGENLCAVVIDFTLCRGFDGSLVGVLQQLAALASQHSFTLQFAGLYDEGCKWLKSHTAEGICFFHADLDRALESVERNLLARLGITQNQETVQPTATSDGRPQQLSSDNLTAMDSSGWSLVLLYSNASAESRSARPGVAQAMALLEGRCSFFEASVDKCPGLVERFGPAPVLVLLRKGQEQWRLSGGELSRPPQAGAAGTATQPVADEIAQQVRRQIWKADTEGLLSLNSKRIRATDVEDLTVLPPARGVGAAEELRRRISKQGPRGGDHEARLAPGRQAATWKQFLELTGLLPDGPLMKLSSYVKGPLSMMKGQVLLHKGEAAGSVFFIASGLVNLWNEGRCHEQDVASTGAPASPTQSTKAREMQDHRRMLARGTSRLLRVGPGWVLGGSPGTASGVSAPLVPLTCLAETEVEVFELTKEDALRLQQQDPSLMLLLHGLLMHFTAILVQHLAVQLSDWHSLLYAC